MTKKVKELNHILWSYKKYYLVDRDHVYFFLKALKENILIFFGFKRLGKMFLSPSFQCNASCPHCFERFQFNDKKAYLNTKECKDIIDQFKKMGGYLIYFCSGEFLLREDALELIKYCSSKNIATSITTNGIILDEKKIDELKEAGLTLLVVSIDSSDPVKHDLLRGAGTFLKAKNGLILAKQKGIRTQIWTYMTKSHSNELEGISKFCEEVGADLVYVFFTLLSGALFNKFEENFTFNEREDLRKKYAWKKPIILEFPKEDWLCRGGGKDHVNVLPTGDVTYCPPIPYSYGNVREKSLSEILEVIRKDYKKFIHCSCGQCPVNFPEYREKCNGRFVYPEI